MTPSIPVIVYVVLQFVAFFFVLVGTPIDMFRSSNSSVFVGQCITLWGMRHHLHPSVRRSVHAGLYLLFCCSLLRWVCLVLNVVGMVTSCIVWAAMAVTYNKTDDRVCLPVKTLGRYGAGFVLFVLAWILDVINIILLLLPYDGVDAGANRKAELPTAQE
ncbi:Amastin surface glycofamily protein [Leishmania donovani]|uniref:Amastin surface glycofamily protein n=1 Tax=Leishmania donovani TaxID=5661 RepID=A0A504XR95_LEIDO|nr:Amastin surface glycofamily protein [Leishmania donovani]